VIHPHFFQTDQLDGKNWHCCANGDAFSNPKEFALEKSVDLRQLLLELLNKRLDRFALPI
jgi:hypothetical protein